MYKIVKLIFLFLFSFPALFAQMPAKNIKTQQIGYGVIGGLIQDEHTKASIPYASAILYKLKDSSMLMGVVSDETGQFLIEKVNPGKYYLKISFIGYDNKFLNTIDISPKNADIQLGIIRLKPSSSALDGVTITAERSIISNNLDKKVIYIDKNMAMSGGSATDIMQNVPNVTVDAEGNVSLRGNANITILIDGKPATQTGLSSSDILAQLPANAVQSIELVTNPSVKYDPEGASGIINIILKKKALQGFSGQLSTMAGTNEKYNGALNLNYRKNKWSVYFGIDGRYAKNKSFFQSERTSFDYLKNIIGVQKQEQNGFMTHGFFNITGGADYTINTRNSISFNVANRNMNIESNGKAMIKDYNAQSSLQKHYGRDNVFKRNMDFMNYTLSYKKTFAEKDREWTTDLTYNTNGGRGTQNTSLNNYDSLQSTWYNLPNQKNYNENYNKLFSVQSNYIHPFDKWGRVETGFKTSFRNMAATYDNMDYKEALKTWVPADAIKKYDYTEWINAVYAIYGNSHKRLKYQAGLRFENVLTTYKTDRNENAFEKTFNSFYPSFHTQYELAEGKELQLSYSRRVNRPSPREMNPFVDKSDPKNISMGNPDLKPEFTNSLELGYMQYWMKGSLSSTIFYRNTNGEVESIVAYDTATHITTTQPFNVGVQQSYGLELIGAYNPAKWLRINSNVSFYGRDNAAINIANTHVPENNSFDWRARINATFNYLKNGNIQLVANYRSPRNDVQLKRKENFTVDLSARQDFFKDRLSLIFRVTDVFNQANFNATTFGQNFTTLTKRTFESRVFYLGLQFKINNYNAKKTRTPNDTDMQDMDTGIEM